MKIMRLKSVYLALCIITMCSCSNDSVDELLENGSKSSIIDSLSLRSGMLNFTTEAEFARAIEILSDLNEQEREKWVESNCGKIISLKMVYEKAMEDAEQLDESRTSYENFKDKYGKNLFFAEYKDDYGVYLPVSNEIIASLLNADGEVCINGQVKNMKDICCYSQLQELGVAMYDYNDDVVTRSKGEVEAEYDSKWYSEDGRKIRVKCGRQVLVDTGILTTPVSMRMHIEISFRKKTWIGWVNYSSRISLTGSYTISDRKIAISENKTADSSHDYYYDLPYAMPVPFNNTTMRLALPISVELKIDYRGIAKELDYNFTLPAAYM